MARHFTTHAIENNTNAALEMMAALAVLIVAALLFAAYGLREERTATMARPGLAASTQGQVDRLAVMRRLPPDRNGATVRATRAAPTPLIDRL